jgi:co-chaperonin GroES (HSP10)
LVHRSRQLGVERHARQAVYDRTLVQRLEEGEQQVGAIIIPDSARGKPQRGTVIAAGNGKPNDDGERVSLNVRAGDQDQLIRELVPACNQRLG